MNTFTFAFTDGEMSRQYEAALTTMVEALAKWRRENPALNPMVQFNFPRNVCLAAVISDAINFHWVSVDGAGQNLISALCAPFPRDREPTVLMVRAVIENF